VPPIWCSIVTEVHPVSRGYSILDTPTGRFWSTKSQTWEKDPVDKVKPLKVAGRDVMPSQQCAGEWVEYPGNPVTVGLHANPTEQDIAKNPMLGGDDQHPRPARVLVF
jgi:hypothetical protein